MKSHSLQLLTCLLILSSQSTSSSVSCNLTLTRCLVTRYLTRRRLQSTTFLKALSLLMSCLPSHSLRLEKPPDWSRALITYSLMLCLFLKCCDWRRFSRRSETCPSMWSKKLWCKSYIMPSSSSSTLTLSAASCGCPSKLMNAGSPLLTLEVLTSSVTSTIDLTGQERRYN